MYARLIAKSSLPVLALAATILSTAAQAQQTFASPDEAAAALAAAARANDPQAITKVLGKRGSDIVASGDPVADADLRKQFVTSYEQKHDVKVDGSKATLIIGNDDFPLPIPLVQRDNRWQFDTVSGRQEILARRIGRNELAAIQAALAYVDAQNEYAEKDRTGAGPGVYAQRIVSTGGKKDGLFWPAAQGEDESPLGDRFAEASREGYRPGATPIPYHGYRFKVLTRQGSNAPGGTLNYVAGGKMIGGFALVAYPAEYGNSGVMTFLVRHDGVVLQKDLGPQTAKVAPRMTSYDPDKTWTKVADTDLTQ